MLRKLTNLMKREEKGITGLETAIILIAFVVVAAVFAYTVLSAGLFSTQKSQEAIRSGLEEAQSTVELKGAVIGKAENTGASGYMSQLTFTLSNALGGEPLNFTGPDAAAGNTGLADSASDNVVVISYIDNDQRVEDLYWVISNKLGNSDTDDLIEAGEKFQITIGNATAGAGGGNLVDALNPNLTVNKQFTIEIKTAKGAVLAFERTTPSNIDSVVNFN